MSAFPRGSSHFIVSGGVTLHVRADENSAGPTLAYINSLGSDLRIWDGVVGRLAGFHLRHDLRGHGLSDAPAGPYSIAAMADDLRRILEQAELEPVVLIGISVGGLIALRFALEWPGTVRALVICDSAARIGTRESWSERIAKVESDGLDSIAEAVVTRWFSPGFGERQPATLAGYLNMLRRTPARGYAATCAALREEDLRDEVGRISTPTLVLCGSDDVSTPAEQARELASALPNGRYCEIPKAGHLPCIERPQETAQAIEAFLQEVDHG